MMFTNYESYYSQYKYDKQKVDNRIQTGKKSLDRKKHY